jgi:hypothetical protein
MNLLEMLRDGCVRPMAWRSGRRARWSPTSEPLGHPHRRY